MAAIKLILEIVNQEGESWFGKKPTAEMIRESLLTEDFDFAVLSQSKDDLSYIQCRLIQETEKYLLEYQDGTEDLHYQTENPVSYSRAVSAFIWYLRGDESWLSEFTWERIEV